MNGNERSFAPDANTASVDALEEKLSECKKRIDELHGEIGKAYCLVAGDAPMPELEALVKEVKLNEKLALEYTGKIDALSGSYPCPVCGKPVAEGSLFCSSCGASLNAEIPAGGETPAAEEETPVEPAAPAIAPAEETPAESDASETVPAPQPEEPKKTCPHCGAPAVGDLPFCMVCGNRIDDAPAPAPETDTAAPQGRVCPVCGAPAVGDMPFCTSCGNRLDSVPAPAPAPEPEPAPVAPQGRVCPFCGASVAEDVLFCTSCGCKLPVPAPAPEPVPVAPQGRVCPVCGAPAADGVLFCVSCGSKLDAAPAKRFCTVCGNEVPEGNLFCTVCGAKM